MMLEKAVLIEEEPNLIDKYKENIFDSVSWVVNIYLNELLPNMSTK